ncbi:MAG TPA: hypothetical protein VF407_19650 [Polyangiaceae bacterium]
MANGIHGLCSWKKAPTAATLKRVGVAALFEKFGIGASAQDLFGEEPATFVHEGDVVLDGPTLLEAQGNGVFVVDGSLTIDGAFTFYGADAYTVLVVTGDLRAAHFQQAQDTQLVVLGETKIDGLLSLDLSDAGFALFRGPVTSRDRVVAENGVDYAVPMFAKKPKGTARTFDDSPDPKKLHAKLVAGTDLFPAPPKGALAKKGAKKPPSTGAIQKMSVDQVLAEVTSDFETITIENAIVNPKWFRKGKPGEPVKNVALNGETYVAELPESLATIRSLTLLGQEDGERLAKMLRSLPRLRALESLRISGTALTALPADIGELASLRALEIEDNKALASLPPELAKLKLRKLAIRSKTLQTLPKLDLDAIEEVAIETPALTLER